MNITVRDIAKFIGATVVGSDEILISGPSRIEQGTPGTITFLANPKYIQFVYTTSASAIIVPQEFSPEEPIKPTLLKVADPYSAFSSLLELANKARQEKVGIESPSFVSESSKIGEDVYIGAFAYVGEGAKIGNNVKIYPNVYIGDHAVIGDNSIIYPNTTIAHGCRIGKSCVIHSGVVLGSDGFGFAPQKDGSLKKVPQTGIVVLEDDVEIGANTTIDRATMGETVIKKGVKIDNLVQIAHNVEVGDHTVVAAQTGISGSTRIGKRCMFGGQVGVAGHLNIADETKFGAKSGVSKNIRQKGMVLRGRPAQELNKQLRAEALIRQLEKMENRIRDLENQLKESRK